MLTWCVRARRRPADGVPLPNHPPIERQPHPFWFIGNLSKRLDPVTLLSLSLTCRAYYRHYYTKSTARHLSAAQREALLLLLERDAPAHYYCHHCAKLHPWHAHWFRSWAAPYQTAYCGDPKTWESRAAQNLWQRLPYHFARVVVNAHLYGPSHGVPASALAAHYPRVRRHYCANYSSIIRTESWSARVVGSGQLMMASELTLSHSRADAAELRNYLDRSGQLVLCGHLWIGNCPPNRCVPELLAPGIIPGAPTILPPPNAPCFEPCSRVLRSCRVCLTDYRVDIDWRGPGIGWVVRIATYHQFGTVRSPFDREWRLMTFGSGSQDVPREQHPAEGRPGTVRRAWEQAKWEEKKAEAEALESWGWWDKDEMVEVELEVPEREEDLDGEWVQQ